jgi:dTDP-4-dehydrorhamnose 3,5-epimerase
MKVERLSIPDILTIEPQVYTDDRGLFFESFNQKKFESIVDRSVNFVQDNQSHSKKNVLRGLHYQVSPMEQAKLVRVISGKVFDVVVDIRKESPTYKQWVGKVISSENMVQMWIPEGFAHGFYTLSDSAILLYKTTSFYSKEHERIVLWEDQDLGINWKNTIRPILSDKDANAKILRKI